MRRKGGTALVPFELLILSAALALRRVGIEEFHGYALQEHLEKETGKAQLHGFSTLYRALRKLEAMGSLESWWVNPAEGDESERPRRMYRLTMKGIGALHEQERDKKVKVPRGKRVTV